MEISEYKNIFDNEKTHFFYVSTHNLVIWLTNKWVNKKTLSILDAGCGTGGLMGRLDRYGKVMGVDTSEEAIRFSKNRGLTVKKASLDELPFMEKSFDLVTCIDVIYHLNVANDVEALSEIRRVLKSDGMLILRVPANKYLMSAHDRLVHTARRYQKDELIKKMAMAGFCIKQISFVHSPIFLLNLIRISLEKFLKTADHSSINQINPIINQILIWVLNLEARLIIRGASLPFGQGLICVAQPIKRPPTKRAVKITPKKRLIG